MWDYLVEDNRVNHLVTFSDASMGRSRRLCISSALKHGVDLVFDWDDKLLSETEFYRQNELLLSQPRGCGYFAWKPFIVDWYMAKVCQNSEFLIYSDAGIEFINNVHYIIDRMDQDIFLFGNNWEHAHWCKRDAVVNIWPVKWFLDGNKPQYPYVVPNGAVAYDANDGGIAWDMFSKQAQASVIFFRVSNYSRLFVKEWLDWCLFEGGRLIDDSPSRTPNHPEFREHRHDQAILTTMAYRDGLKLHYWPAMYNDGAFTYEKLPEYAGDDYPTLFHHHRRRNHEWEAVA